MPPRKKLDDLAVLPTVGTTDSLAALGLSRLRPTRKQVDMLRAPWSEEDIKIRPDRLIYVSAQSHRDRLTDTFGPGSWGELPHGEPRVENGLVIQGWTLMIDGKAVATCLGECQWNPENRQMSKGDAVEGARSNALTRNCKGLTNQDWRKPRWAADYVERVGVLVKWRQTRDGWRHKDDPPLDKESGLADLCPPHNRVDYTPPGPVRLESSRVQPGQQQRAREQQQGATEALVVTSTLVISGKSSQQIGAAMATHGMSIPTVRAFLQKNYNITSRTQIQQCHLAEVMAFVEGRQTTTPDAGDIKEETKT